MFIAPTYVNRRGWCKADFDSSFGKGVVKSKKLCEKMDPDYASAVRPFSVP